MSISLSKKDKQFVDISLSFEPNPVTGDLTVLKDARAINNSLKNLVLIAPYEVPFRADVGSNAYHMLFELMDEGTGLLLEREIERTIAYNEPRVEVQDITVTANYDSNEYRARIQYKIVGSDEIFEVTQILKSTNLI